MRSPDGDAVMVVRNLAPAPEGKTYEAWVIDSGGPVKAGLFEGGGQEIVLLEEPVGRRRDGRRHARARRRIRTADRRHPLRERGSLMGGERDAADRDPGRKEATARALASLSDEALLAIIATPDGDLALAELYDRYGKIAYGLAYRVLRDSALAEDAVQEAFITVWRTAGTYIRERGKPRTWLLTLVHRRAVDLVRREQRRRVPAAAEEPVPATPAAEDEATLRDRRRAVQAALTQLPADQREALELAYYGGLTQTELAQQLGVPLGTVKSRMFAGLRRLGDLLREAGLEAEPEL